MNLEAYYYAAAVRNRRDRLPLEIGIELRHDTAKDEPTPSDRRTGQ